MKKILSLLILVALFAPLYADAKLSSGCGSTGGSASTGSTGGSASTGVTGGSASSPTKIGLSNPVKGAPNLACFFYRIVDFVMSLSYVVIAFFLLLSGFKFVTAQGSDDKLTEAKRTFWYTIIGALILIGANTIIEVVQSIMKGLQG